MGLLKANGTLQLTDEEWKTFSFSSAYVVQVKGRRYLMILDSFGHVNYFTTRAFKNFVFSARLPTGKNKS